MKSDSELQHEVEDVLVGLQAVVDENLEVRVSAGVVTLTGSVRSFAERWSADDAVRRVDGVTDVLDKTMVMPEPARQPDGDIARPWFP